MKKNILLLTALTLTLNLWANDLTQAESRSLMRGMNNICWDTWCEGNFEFTFETISCDFSAESCVIDLEVYELVFDRTTNISRDVLTPASCVIAVKDREFFENEPTERRRSYSYNLWDTISEECIENAQNQAAANR